MTISSSAPATTTSVKPVKYSIYWMRFLAVVFIVNSHFVPEHVPGMQPFALYGKLGFFGNMIFVFISAYILSWGFRKYESDVRGWLVYRVSYLLIVILTLSVAITLLTGKGVGAIIPEIAGILFTIKSVIAVLVALSILFPVFYFSSLARWGTAALSWVAMLILAVSFELSGTLTDGSMQMAVINALGYLIIFQLGIMVAKNEINISFSTPSWNMIACGGFIALLLLTERLVDSTLIKMVVYTGAIMYMFYASEAVNFGRLPSWINRPVAEIAKLSFYIYMTHFSLVALAYQISRPLALVVVFAMLIPICYAQHLILNPVIERIKRAAIGQRIDITDTQMAVDQPQRLPQGARTSTPQDV